MRIAFAVVRFFEYGGMQRTMLRMARECVRRGCELTVYCNRWEAEHPVEFSVVELSARSWTNHGVNKAFGEAVRKAVAADPVDCLVGFNKIPGLDLYYAGDPCFKARAHDLGKGPLYRSTPRYRTYSALERSVFGPGLDTGILLFAHGELGRYQEYHGTELERFHLLPPGIDRERLEEQVSQAVPRDELLAGLGINPSSRILLNIGSGYRTKGVDRIVRGLASLPTDLGHDTHLLVVGSGDEAPFENLARRLGVADRVHFTGPTDNVGSYYLAADLLVHPAYTENTGTTLIESLVCGLPVLTTANCGFSGHVEESGGGVVCPVPFVQERFNDLLVGMLEGDREIWIRHGQEYCRNEDLYGLVEGAVGVIMQRAEANRLAQS